jgi:hypothetical protein
LGARLFFPLQVGSGWQPDASLDATARIDRRVRIAVGAALQLERCGATLEPRLLERLMAGLATTERLVAAGQVAVRAFC